MDSPSNESDSPGQESFEQSYPPRVCRICLETVWPTFQPSEFFQRSRLVYESSDPESGRLLRPCKCKGSSRYVHEGCLQSWRTANPSLGTRNYWECPTCRFQYRLERLTWARWISSTATQLILTLAILILTIFLLGFVADPVIDLYVGAEEDFLEPTEDASWLDHFVKGLAALGLTSCLRALLMSPSYWIRGSGLLRNRRSNGRNRAANLNWLVIMTGVVTFLWAVYKGVRSWSKRTLQWAGDKVMDVPLPEDEDEEDIVAEEPCTHPKSE
ncbi:Zinc finger RING-CH-type [Penicillium verhagenii]|nr:Zinc finger RING-CH-type [Penicillium verhagenii]